MSHQSDLIADNIEAYLHQHEQKDILRFITCGSVDDGKSTLIGRLLHDSKMIYEDQLAAIEKDSKSVGTTGTQADLALLVDGLQSEREQGITIDVAYRFYSTDKRKFIIADTPGHEQYTRNMATGASSAQLAVLLIDARHGVQVQTRRHSYICSLLGIKHFVVAINKMDLVDFSQERFEEIKAEYTEFAAKLNVPDIHFVPMSALTGDNVVSTSENMPWYDGNTMMTILEEVPVANDANLEQLTLPVQYVNRPNLNFRGFCGTLASGIAKVGQQIQALPSGKTSTIKEIYVSSDLSDEAFPGQAITLTLNDEIDISRGDVIVSTDHPMAIGNEFKADIVWMTEKPLTPGKLYDFKLATTYASGTVSGIDYQTDVNTLEHTQVEELALNGIGQCHVKLTQSVVHDLYRNNHTTGSFIVIDRLTNVTVGAGMISQTIEVNESEETTGGRVTPAMRAAIKPHSGKCVWLSAVTATETAENLEYSLNQSGMHTYLLDAASTTELLDENMDTGEQLRRLAQVAKLMSDAGLIVLVDFAASCSELEAVSDLFDKDQFVCANSNNLSQSDLLKLCLS